MVYRLAAALAVVMLAMTIGSVAAAEPGDPARLDAEPALAADLEGVPIPLATVGKYHCNDFDYPTIHCFRSATGLEASVDVEVALGVGLQSGIAYVQIYQDAGFGGASMVVSQDYSALAAIGWNDRISSFKGKNSQTGTFYTDWFAGGTAYGFCCNQQVVSLGGFNDTFSSVYNN